VLFCPNSPLQRCDLHNKVSKKFVSKKFPDLIITFKIDSGNQPLVTEDYRFFLFKANLEFSSTVTLKIVFYYFATSNQMPFWHES
jgi:hypothetical protein